MFVVSINPVPSWVIVSVCLTANKVQVSKCAAFEQYFLWVRRNMFNSKYWNSMYQGSYIVCFTFTDLGCMLELRYSVFWILCKLTLTVYQLVWIILVEYSWKYKHCITYILQNFQIMFWIIFLMLGKQICYLLTSLLF